MTTIVAVAELIAGPRASTNDVAVEKLIINPTHGAIGHPATLVGCLLTVKPGGEAASFSCARCGHASYTGVDHFRSNVGDMHECWCGQLSASKANVT